MHHQKLLRIQFVILIRSLHQLHVLRNHKSKNVLHAQIPILSDAHKCYNSKKLCMCFLRVQKQQIEKEKDMPIQVRAGKEPSRTRATEEILGRRAETVRSHQGENKKRMCKLCENHQKT